MRTYEMAPELELEAELEYALRDATFRPGVGEFQATPRPAAGPAFRLACAGGCGAGTEAQCRRTLRRDLVTAVQFAERAAQLLEARPRSARTSQLYLQVFGHRPERPIPWAPGFRDSGMLTARRFRMAADALNRRVIHFACRPQPPTHPNRNAGVPHTVGGAPNRLLIRLYPRYWTRPAAIRAGVLVHEVLHLIFLDMFRHNSAERRRINAHCYEWLVLRLNNRAAVAADLTACRNTPA